MKPLIDLWAFFIHAVASASSGSLAYWARRI